MKKTNVCPCCVKFSSKFFVYFSAPSPIEYLKYDSTNIVFEDQTVLLKHLKTENRPEEFPPLIDFIKSFTYGYPYINIVLVSCPKIMSIYVLHLCQS